MTSELPQGTPVNRRRSRRFLLQVGPIVVGLGLVSALASFAVFTGFTPIVPTDAVVIDVFIADAVIVLVIAALVAVEAFKVIAAWRARTAGARLHAYIVALFSVTAAVPAIIMAVVGAVALQRGLYPAFMDDVRGFIGHTADAARLYRASQCNSLLREADLTASDLDRAKIGLTDRSFFQNYFSSRVQSLGFTTAVLMKSDGSVTERVDTGRPPEVVRPDQADFADARNREPVCFVLNNGRSFVALRYLPSFEDTFLYVVRPIDPFAIEFPQQAQEIINLYDAFDSHRRSIQIAFIVMYGLLAMIMLLSAVWLGLSFANQIVAPIRRLIHATDQVSTGNLYVQVPVRRTSGDLARLGQTFNKMTSELRLQQNRLIAARETIDERRQFTEAVLSGVPAAVIGIGAKDEITVLNATAARVLGPSDRSEGSLLGQPLPQVIPELGPALAEARAGRQRLTQSQITMVRGSRERTFNVRVTGDSTGRAERPLVVTLDDITDLMTAQRTSAWADVARRIAHEIKNPLTPIQLSAERLKRRYSRVITEGRDVFDQCTDTIIRQVDDLKRMVDEFSSFARMPKANPQEDDLLACVAQVVFMMRVAHPDITFEERLPADKLILRFDRRLLSQAVTNIVKNATEGIAARRAGGDETPGVIEVGLAVSPDKNVLIDIVDNGKGFPAENRHRLLEPYMTTRSEGTGLGLAIVAKILEDHGGGIELLDAVGHPGAHVRLHFPVDASRTPAGSATEPVTERA